mgnify:CR=1 FL=1
MRLIPLTQNNPVSDLDSLFGRYLTERPLSTWAPQLDLFENKEELRVQVDLPGVDKQNISVTLEDGLLSISGKRSAEHEAENPEGHWLRVERRWGSFERHLRLGDGVDADKVRAEAKDGVLTVHIPKKEQAKPRNISVN